MFVEGADGWMLTTIAFIRRLPLPVRYGPTIG